MKYYNLIPQENDKYCLCSIIQAILGIYGIKISQIDIGDELTSSDKGFLAHDIRIKDFLMSKGFEYKFYWYNATPYNEPDEFLTAIVPGPGILPKNDASAFLVKTVIKNSDPPAAPINFKNFLLSGS